MTCNATTSAALVLAAICGLGCSSTLRLTPNDADAVLGHQMLTAPNPALPGPLRIHRLYYGSGSDLRRPEFRDSVAFTTDPVDASKLVDLGRRAKQRNRYWGFAPDSFPLNGRVWYPDGDGPFPLVLIVHGNHNPKDFSDPGYEYLGELLASRGFVLTSVDMNFINGIGGENDARGWLLLKHLQAWRTFNDSPDNPFYGKVDLERIALIGHSRGGEAVGHAAAFNRLRYYPDDASLAFDFNFGIQSIIAIAPVDGQYRPTGRPVPVENVNYLVFHGSHDGDVTSFHGLRQYHRVRFTDGSRRFKAAAYMYRANHGQWNTVWGRRDSGRRSGRILDLGALISADDQREFGKLYIGAFLEATLKNDERYLPMFRDYRVVGGWLPKTMYVTQFQASSFRPLATFEEDIDVTTGTIPGVTLHGDSLQTWKEDRLALRSRNRATTSGSQENQAVWLGWNNRIAGEDTTTLATPGSYAVMLPDSLAGVWAFDPHTTLDLLLAATNATPAPREGTRDTAENAGARRDDRGAAEGRDAKEDRESPPIDLTVEVADADGAVARVSLSRYAPVRRPLEIGLLRRKDQEKERFSDTFDVVLQSYSIVLSDFVAANARLNLSRLRWVRLVFDRSPAGTVVVDDIGFSALDPAFTRVHIDP